LRVLEGRYLDRADRKGTVPSLFDSLKFLSPTKDRQRALNAAAGGGAARILVGEERYLREPGHDETRIGSSNAVALSLLDRVWRDCGMSSCNTAPGAFERLQVFFWAARHAVRRLAREMTRRKSAQVASTGFARYRELFRRRLPIRWRILQNRVELRYLAGVLREK